jgi:uncharacterized protein
VKREASEKLDAWLTRPRRKPLVLRGARQVGKTWLVRELARRSKRELIELNFERNPGLARHFDASEPRAVLAELSLALGRDVDPSRSLLFLDEIQAAGQLFGKLRWFAEELPELPVLAAGSLLELTLGDLEHGVPVGRISYFHVEPLGFPEFLRAHQQEQLLGTLAAWSHGRPISPAAHDRGGHWLARYSMVGGMPGIVAADIDGATPAEVRQLQRDLVSTFRDDFARYGGRMDRNVLDDTLLAVAASLGQKFVYTRASEGVKRHQAKRALELLAAARVCHLVRHTAANGLPLGGQAKDSFRKALLLDIGLLHALLGTPAARKFPDQAQLAPSIRGQLAEQLIGQALRLLGDPHGTGHELFYWQREGGRPGEIDYVLELAGRIVPVELKAGASGAMKSLHQFMHEKRLELAVRFDTNPPSATVVDVRTTQGDPVRYRLLSLPAYLTFRLPALLD